MTPILGAVTRHANCFSRDPRRGATGIRQKLDRDTWWQGYGHGVQEMLHGLVPEVFVADDDGPGLEHRLLLARLHRRGTGPLTRGGSRCQAGLYP